MPHNKVKSVKLVIADQVTKKSEKDYLAVEAPLEIRLSHDLKHYNTLSVTMCSPEDISELITGYLFTEQITNSANDIIHIELFENDVGYVAEVQLKPTIKIEPFINKRHGMVHASCGICGKTSFDDLLVFNYPVTDNKSRVNSEILRSLPKALNQQQTGFAQTGGIHASALFTTDGKLLYMMEDIGRHNALDKLIGKCLLNNQNMNDHILLLSGRISFELTHKALISGVNIIAAIGAPSSLSVELAENNGMTMVGFIKSQRFNIYTSSDRIDG